MRAAGLPVEVLIEYVSLFNEGDSTVAARKELLTEQRDQLKNRIAELESTLARLNRKIENYESKCIPFEKKLKAEKTDR